MAHAPKTVIAAGRPSRLRATVHAGRTEPRRQKVGKAQSPDAVPTAERRYRQTIQKVDLWTVLKISICFYLTALIVALFAAAMLWWIASAIGFVGQVEDFVGELVNSEDFEFLSWTVLRARRSSAS